MKLSKLFLGLAALTVAAGLCGCSVQTGVNNEPQPSDIVAKATAGNSEDDMQITYEDFSKHYLFYLYSREIDDTAAETAEQCKAQRSAILDNLINEKVILQMAAEMGVDSLTDSETEQVDAQFEEQTQQNINYFIQKLEGSSSEFSELSDEEKQERGSEEYDKLLENCKMTKEDMRRWLVNTLISQKLMEKVGEEVEYSDAEKTATEYIADFENVYLQSPAAYAQGNYSLLWIPEGARMIKHILIGFDDEIQSQIRSLRTDGKDNEADKLRADEAAKLQDKVDEVQNKLAGGADFDDLITEYSADAAGSASSPNGYLVIPNGETYMQEFQETAFVPQKIGDTAVCTTDYGVHIMIYADDAKVSEEQIKNFTDYIYQQSQQEYYYNKVLEWRDNLKFDIDYDALRLDDPDDNEESENISLYPYSGSNNDNENISLYPYSGSDADENSIQLYPYQEN